MNASSRGIVPSLILTAVLTSCGLPIIAQQSGSATQSGLQSAGQQAISALLKQIVLDPTVLVQSTGKPLPANGNWSVGKEAPASCPQTADTCVRIFYKVSDANVLCEWVIRLNGDGSDGIILEQNADASRYLLRKISTSEAASLVATRKKPEYPGFATAAHVGGQVLLRVFVSENGTIEKAFIVNGPEMLRASAMDAIKAWVFKPLMVGTQAARFETDVTFEYKTFGPGSGTVKSKP